jgi:alpha-tubulin suppressor-like RCC1 family protein
LLLSICTYFETTTHLRYINQGGSNEENEMQYSIMKISLIMLIAGMVLAACGGGGGGGAPAPAPTQNFTVGGNVSGLSGTLVISNNGSENITLSSNGGFSFPTALNDGSTYNISIPTSPTNQTCTINNNIGAINAANVVDVNVTCGYSVGGNVSNLTGTGLVLHGLFSVVHNQNLIIRGGGNYHFTTLLTDNDLYAISVDTQPSNQTCTVSHDNDKIHSSNVTDVNISCIDLPPPPSSYFVGGTVTGLLSGALWLRNNGSDLYVTAADGKFRFATPLGTNETYSVTVAAPIGITCTVISGSGTIINANINDIAVNCSGTIPSSFTVGGTVSGLTGTGLMLFNKASGSRFGVVLPISNNGVYSFLSHYLQGVTYDVAVSAQPSNPTQNCIVANGTGTVNSSDVTNVAIYCSNHQIAFSIATGDYHSCALLNVGLTDIGPVKCWGANYSGTLGLGDKDNRGDSAGQMGDLLPSILLGSGHNAKEIAAGTAHTCALLDDNSIKCWGYNNFGQLGLGDLDDRGVLAGQMANQLPNVALGTGITASKVVAGNLHTCALLSGTAKNGQVACWGYNYQGQLGFGNTTNRGGSGGQMGNSLMTVDLGSIPTAVNLAAGGNHTCAILDNGSLKCWGSNAKGELGQGDTTERGTFAFGPIGMGDLLHPIDLGTGNTAVQVVTGNEHTCVRLNTPLNTSIVKCWGSNSDGQLGLGNKNNVGNAAGQMGNNLASIALGTGRTAIQIAAGGSHTCALLDTHQIKCWGSNKYGQLGQGNTDNIGVTTSQMGDLLRVVDIGPGHTAVAVAAGETHTCALLDDSTVKCWGGNADGQLGQGNTDSRGVLPGQMALSLPVVDLGTQ